MKRDIVCIMRIAVDSLPSRIRNSLFLFRIAQLIFKLPDELFDFRDRYKQGSIENLSIYYGESAKALNNLAETTDINSFHLKHIYDQFLTLDPLSVLDIGCGSGYLLNSLHSRSAHRNINFHGVDYSAPLDIYTDNNINFWQSDLFKFISQSPDNCYDLVLCTHVIEHLSNPENVIQHIRRISKKAFILICPLEKEFRWGVNYHINFYSTEKDFLETIIGSEGTRKIHNYNTIVRLQDILYIECIT